MTLLGAALLFLHASSAAGQWFPERMKAGATKQVADGFRNAEIQPPDMDPTEFEKRVRGLVEQMAKNIETLGLSGLERHEPKFSEFEIPHEQDPLLALMNGYGMCTLPLHLELAADNDQRLYVVVGEVAVILISAYLRHEFLARGGTDQQIKTAMTTKAIEKLGYDIQAEKELRDHVSMTCAPVLTKIMAGPE